MLLRDDQWVRIETLLPGKSGDRGRSGANNATLLPVDWLFATIDCTLKIVGPAAGERLIAHGRVLKYGRLLTVATAEVYIESGGRRELTATALVQPGTLSQQIRADDWLHLEPNGKNRNDRNSNGFLTTIPLESVS